MAAGLSIPIEAVDAFTCAAQSDVICTCTNAHTPLFDGNLLRPGTHLNLIGTFQPQAREVDSITIQRAQVVVETYEGALAEAGDLLIPISEGLITREHVRADLHELVSGKKTARRSREDITVFKSVGCALEDLVTAELLGLVAGAT
jgi:ornithine cyclodeaminase